MYLSPARTLGFTYENSPDWMSGQCLHFVELNSRLGPSSRGEDRGRPQTGTGCQEGAPQRALVAAMPGMGEGEVGAEPAGAPGIGW